MPILPEQVRTLSSEENLIDDATEYTATNAAWATLKSYGNIVLAAASLVAFSFDYSCPGGVNGDFRLKIGSYYVWGINNYAGTGVHVTATGIAYIPAGTHAVIVETKSDGGPGTNEVANFQLGNAKFLDEQGSALAAYASQISKTVAARTTCVGALKQAVFMVRCWAQTVGGQTNFENVGGSETNGVSLAVDGVQVDWAERNQDPDSDENASATWYGALTVASAHTFAITKDNANTVVHISVYASPWILYGSNHEPVTLDFPLFSTLYVTLEPLDLNPIKYVYLGKKHAVSYGDAADYYSTDNGVDILDFSYTYQLLQVSSVMLYVKGLGGCISHIGVDMR